MPNLAKYIRAKLDKFRQNLQPVDVVSNNPAVLRSKRARATLPQTFNALQEAREAAKLRIEPINIPSINNYFEPIPGKVRFRDVYREIPGAAKEFVQDVPKGAARLYLEGQKQFNKLPGQKYHPSNYYTPKSNLARGIFGEDTIKPASEYHSAQWVQDYLSGKGLPQGVSKLGGTLTGLAVAGAMADPRFIGGEEKSVKPIITDAKNLQKEIKAVLKTIQQQPFIEGRGIKEFAKGRELLDSLAKYGDKVNPQIKREAQEFIAFGRATQQRLRGRFKGNVKFTKKELGLSSELAEARKYKTPEEFVKAQRMLFRSGELRDGRKGLKGDYFAISRKGASAYSDRGKLGEFVLGQDAKVLNYNNIPANLKPEPSGTLTARQVIDAGGIGGVQNKAYNYAKRKGFDAFTWGDGEVNVINRDVLKTKSQLTDIWNKAYGLDSQAGFANIGEGIEGAKETGRKIIRILRSQDESSRLPESKIKLKSPQGSSRATGEVAALKSMQQSIPDTTLQAAGIPRKPPQLPSTEIVSSPQPLPNKFIKSSIDFAHDVYTNMVDRFHPMFRLAKKAGKKAQMEAALAGHYGIGSKATYHIDFQLAPLLRKHNVNNVREAAIALRDIELAQRGIKGSHTQNQAKQILENLKLKVGDQEYAQLTDTLKQLYRYQDNLVKEYMVDTGIMSQQSFDAMRAKNEFYIPFKRVMDDVNDKLGLVNKPPASVSSQNVIKGIKGSERELVDPIESIVENTYKIVGLGMRQKAARVLANMSDDLPSIIRRIGTDEKIGNKNTIAVFENGKTVNFEVPKEVSEAARALNEDQLARIMKIVSIPTQLFRASATGLNPEFFVPNVSRDLQTAYINAGLNPFKWIRGLIAMARKDELYQQFLKAGGKTSRISIDRPVIQKTAKEAARKGLTIKKPSDLLRIVQAASEYSEQPTRIAVFNTQLQKGLKMGLSQEEAAARAAYWAQEGTVNFGRRGAMMKNVNAVIAFLNARVQGTDRLIRSLKNHPVRTGARLGIAVLTPTLITQAWNRKFKSYNDERVLPSYVRRDNFILMLSDEPIPQLGGAQYIKIPKGEIGRLANPVEEFFDYAYGQSVEIGDALVAAFQGFSPVDRWSDLIPQSIRPPIELTQNKSFFTGYDIVPDWKQNFPAGFQDSAYTSPLFRMIGQKLNISPAKMQHLAEGYGTGLARIAEMSTQPFINKKYTTSKNVRGATINRTPVARRLLGGARRSEEEALKAQQSSNTFLKREIGTLKNAAKRGELPFELAQNKIKELEGKMTVPTKETAGRLDALYGDVNEIASMKSESILQKTSKEKKVYSKISEVFNDVNASDEDKQNILKSFNVTSEDYNYYANANLGFADKLTYVGDKIQEGDKIEILAGMRRDIAGKRIVTNTILDELYKSGIITNTEKKYLKALQWNRKTQSLKLNPTYGKSKKNKKAKIKKAKLKGVTVNKVTVPKVTLKTSKLKTTPRRNIQKLKPLPTRRKINLDVFSVEDFKKRL